MEKTNYTRFREKTYHGDDDFHFSLYSIDNKDMRSILVHRHWHEEAEIVYVESGKMLVEIDGESKTMLAGDICFIAPEQVHEFTKIKNNNCKFFCLVYDLGMLSSPKSTILYKKYLRHIQSDGVHCYFNVQHQQNKKAQQFVIKMIQESEIREIGYEFVVIGNLQCFMSLVVKQKKNSSMTQNHLTPIANMRVKQITNYIEDNYINKISLQDMADLLEISREHFSRFFKDYFQMNFSEYLTNYRVSKATYLLVTTEWSILDVAIASGFNDASYFTNVFTKFMKLTPSAYRKKHQI